MATTINQNDIAVPGTASISVLKITGGTAQPGQQLFSDSAGILTLRFSQVTSTAVDYPAVLGDDLILVTATGKTITLPDAAACAGKIFTVKLTASGSATVATTSAQNIDASTTYSLAAQYNSVTVVSDGTGWQIVAKV